MDGMEVDSAKYGGRCRFSLEASLFALLRAGSKAKYQSNYYASKRTSGQCATTLASVGSKRSLEDAAPVEQGEVAEEAFSSEDFDFEPPPRPVQRKRLRTDNNNNEVSPFFHSLRFTLNHLIVCGENVLRLKTRSLRRGVS